jgi:hypothetical protein
MLPPALHRITTPMPTVPGSRPDSRLDGRTRRVPGRRRALAVLTAPVLLAALALPPLAGLRAAEPGAAAAPAGKPFHRVLIIGITPNFDQRCLFEYALGSQLASEQVTAVVSCDAMGSQLEINRANVEKIARERRVDAVIATRLVASKLATEDGGGRDTRGSAQYKATGAGFENVYVGGWTAYGVPVTYGEFQSSDSITTLKGEVRLLTQVYSTADASLVHSVETKSKNLESGSALARIAEPIAKKLRRDKVVAR